MDNFSLLGMLFPGVGVVFGLYMVITGHFPANFFFASSGYRLRHSAAESSGDWVRRAGYLWLIASATGFLGENGGVLTIVAVVAGIAGLVCLVVSYSS